MKTQTHMTMAVQQQTANIGIHARARKTIACLKTLVSVLVLVAMTAAFASAGNIPIPGLYSTGLTTIGSADPNWMLATPYPSSGSGQSLPSPPWNLAYGPAYANTPDAAWLPNSANSQWITPLAENNLGGNYVYETSFNIPAGYNPATASISGFWTSDNEGVEVWLNHQQITGFPLAGPNGFDTPFPFTIDSSNATFQSGVNTLYFEIRNRGVGGSDQNPTDTGLRVEFDSSSVSPAPEPSSLLMMGSGLLAVAGAARRKLVR